MLPFKVSRVYLLKSDAEFTVLPSTAREVDDSLRTGVSVSYIFGFIRIWKLQLLFITVPAVLL